MMDLDLEDCVVLESLCEYLVNEVEKIKCEKSSSDVILIDDNGRYRIKVDDIGIDG